MALSPYVCIMCMRQSETNCLLFLHCQVAWDIWNKLFGIANENWVCPVDLGSFFAINFFGFSTRKEHRILWKAAVFATVWCLWMERNARVFKQRFLSPLLLWDRIRYVATLWVIANGCFKGIPLLDAHRDWSVLLF